MGKQYYAVTVTFETPIHEDDFEKYELLFHAIRNVISVKPHEENWESASAKERAKAELATKLWNALKD